MGRLDDNNMKLKEEIENQVERNKRLVIKDISLRNERIKQDLFEVYEKKKRQEAEELRQLRFRNFDNMTGQMFEKFCTILLEKNGFKKISLTKGSGDRGVDILAEKNGVSYAIQCKCYSSKIGNHAIQEVYSGRAIYRKDKAVVMTNNFFTEQAIEDAKSLNVELWDGNIIADMIEWCTCYEVDNYEEKNIDNEISKMLIPILDGAELEHQALLKRIDLPYDMYLLDGQLYAKKFCKKTMNKKRIIIHSFFYWILYFTCIISAVLSVLICIFALPAGIFFLVIFVILITFLSKIRKSFYVALELIKRIERLSESLEK